MPDMDSMVEWLTNVAVDWTPKIALAIGIFVIGRMIVRRLSKAAVVSTRKMPTVDETLARFFGSVILFFGMIAVLVSALSAMNVNLAWIGTIVAALFVALGFALQDTLGDFAAGVMLVVFRPYKIGDEVEIGGEQGVVSKLGLFTTHLKTRDGIEFVVGNGSAFGNTIKNFYAYDQRRLDMDFGVSYDANLDEAIAAILKVTEGDARINAVPAPLAHVTGLGDSAVNLQLRLYCHPDEHRNIMMDLSQRVKSELDAAGIEIPYEHAVIIKKG